MLFSPTPLPAVALFLCTLAIVSAERLEERAPPMGIDVSSHQGNVNWSSVSANGVSFAYVKATEGTSYTNPYFTSQYTGAANASLIRGAYHFALPDTSCGATQATYFVANGGRWSDDGITLPGVLDIEYNPYGNDTCYGLDSGSMVSWIRGFSDTYYSSVGRYPVIYTTTNWWKTCTSNYDGFGSTNPLWIAQYASHVTALPAGWDEYTFWQYADSGPSPGDQDYFNGDMGDLKHFAARGRLDNL